MKILFAQDSTCPFYDPLFPVFTFEPLGQDLDTVATVVTKWLDNKGQLWEIVEQQSRNISLK